MKKKSILSVLGLCFILPCFFLLSACGTTPPDEPAEPIKLEAPIVTLNDNIASWTSIDNATSYEVWINNDTNTVAITITQQTLTNYQSLKVRAIGDGEDYLTSDWSNIVTYVHEDLKTPLDEIQNIELDSATQTLKISAVENADSYTFVVKNSQGQEVERITVTPEAGETEIEVKLTEEYVKGSYSVEGIANSTNDNYKSSTPKTMSFDVTQVQSPSISREGNLVTITTHGTGEVTAKIGEDTVDLTKTGDNTYTYQITNNNGGTLEVQQKGNGGFVKDSEKASIKLNLQTTQLSEVQNIKVNSPSKEITCDTVENADSYTFIARNSQNDVVETITVIPEEGQTEVKVQLTKDYAEGTIYVDCIANSNNIEYTSSTTTHTINVTRAQQPTVTFENNVFTVQASGEVVATFNNNAVTLTNGTYTITQDGTLSVTQKGDGGFVLDSEATTLQATFTEEKVEATHAEVVSAIEANLNAHIQSSYGRGTVSNAKVIDVSADGTVYCSYNLGTANMTATVQIEGIADATSYGEVLTSAKDTANYGTVSNKTQVQSTEDALALVEAGMHWGVDALEGYTADDISWATATSFNSAKATDITVVLNDGTMIEYTLTVIGATASSTAKNDYINGCAHNVSTGVESNYESLESKFESSEQSVAESLSQAGLRSVSKTTSSWSSQDQGIEF